jgi:hypothetical protein
MIENPSEGDLTNLYSALGFFSAPELSLPVAETSTPGEDLRLSPLQMALAAASLSNEGVRPAPRLAMAVDTPAEGWVILPGASEPLSALQPQNAASAAEVYILTGTPFWLLTASAGTPAEPFTWSLGGTLPNWQGNPVVVVVLLEEDYPLLANYIAQELLESATRP